MTEFSTMDLQCAYFPLCSGCSLHGDVSSPPVWQDLKNFFHPLPISLVVKEPTHWRSRSKLAVRGTAQNPEIGLFKRASHQVIPIPDCPLHHPSINAVCATVRRGIIERKIDPYEENSGAGTLRYLQFAVERATRRVQLVFVATKITAPLEALVKQLYSEGRIHSIWINIQSEQTNRIFGEIWQHCTGEPYLWERLGNADCAFHPACFGQANLPLYEDVLGRIRAWADPDKQVLELYAGVGSIGLNLLSQSKNVLCVEINPYANECFQLSRLKLTPALQRKIAMKTASAQEAAPLISTYDTIVADPPRKGLDPEVLNALCGVKKGTQLIYLSCGPQSFQKDVERLLAHGWEIEKVEGYLFFPGSDHVEVLCAFRKSH